MNVESQDTLDRVRAELSALAVMTADCSGVDGLDARAVGGLSFLLTRLADDLDRITVEQTA
ncbi:MAG: hypothetical protein EOM22_17180 [Gammaproteobacteria bacterium]|nr:hypothetical protein [Gammaproteobacteria bacterium]